MNANEYSNLRIRKETQRKLKIVAALSEESMLGTLDRLVLQELDRLQGQQKGKQHDAGKQKDQA